MKKSKHTVAVALAFAVAMGVAACDDFKDPANTSGWGFDPLVRQSGVYGPPPTATYVADFQETESTAKEEPIETTEPGETTKTDSLQAEVPVSDEKSDFAEENTYRDVGLKIVFDYSEDLIAQKQDEITPADYKGLTVDFACSNEAESFWCHTFHGMNDIDNPITATDIAQMLDANDITEETYGGYEFVKFVDSDGYYVYVMVNENGYFGFVFNASGDSDVDYMNEILSSVRSLSEE